ncbi:MAG: (d)CMP kinase [Candidatus Margulisbacteria bacterium]|nr:(d)CMP kinase [Candidatus Margulisiibacteriota bacterium]
MSVKSIIAVDGPAASGKSTVAKKLAEKLSITYLSSGSVYRAITYVCLTNNIVADNEKIKFFLKHYNVRTKYGKIFINHTDYSQYLSLPETEKNVSKYSALAYVREFTLEILRNTAKHESIVMDGRDIGTAVFPDANYKFFLTASTEVRAKRRYDEFCKTHPKEKIELKTILSEIIQRDEMDETRELSPLKKAEDAILIDNSKLNIEETIQTIYNYIHK